MTKLNVAFIGGGRITDLHALGYKNNPNARIYAVCDAREEVAQSRAREWEADVHYTDYRQLLADPKVDVVEIITPHHLHAAMSVNALEAGKHVSVQKPMCMNISEANDMVAAADRSDRLFRVMENFRFYAPYIRAKELLERGEIGELRSLRMKNISGNRDHGWNVPDSSWEWRFDPALGGGTPAVFDHGYHMFSIAMYLAGPAKNVYSWINSVNAQTSGSNDSQAMIMWRFQDSPGIGSYEVVRAEDMAVRAKYYASDEWIEITGSEGVIWVNGCSSSFLGVPPVTVYKGGRLTHHTDMETDWADSFVNGTHDLVAAVRDGRSSELTGAEGREVLRFTLAAIRSAELGQEVDIASVQAT
jgi:predicted dehydrogenase